LYEVRITPLMLGVPEQADFDNNPLAGTVIAEEDTVLVEQFSDLEVNHELNEFRTGSVTLSIHDPLVADLEPFAQAVWIGYKRPLEVLSEAILYGQANVITDYAAETVTLEIQDPSIRCQHHYIRRGDAALNIDKGRGRLPAHAYSISQVLNAARNTNEQQVREVPPLGLADSHNYYTVSIDEAPPIEFERGQECWDLIQQIGRAIGGPDFDIHPRWFFPTEGFYAYLWTYNPADPPPALDDTALARDLDPADPDDPQTGEVVFDFGIGQDNLAGLVETPGRPTTHVHVLDQPAVYRETVADAASSAEVGVFVDWIATDFAIPRPTRETPVANTAPLRAIGEARIKSWGRPVKFFTCTMRPDDAHTFHYGHPEWGFSVPEGIEYIGGDWYIGDYVRVRAARGQRGFTTLARITGVKFKQQGSNGLPELDVTMIPAVGGVPGTDPEEVAFGGGSGAIDPGDTESPVTNQVTMGVAIAQGITPAGFEAAPTSTELGIAATHGIAPTDNQAEGSNLIRSLDRRLKLASDGSTFSARGMNVHTAGFSFGQDRFNSMGTNGINAQRLCVQWDNIETSPGVFNTAELNYVQQSIDRAAAAGIKTIICMGINAPQWSTRANVLPSWSYTSTGPATPVAPWDGASLFDVFMSHGEAYSKKMVRQFGANENVAGFMPWNEPDHLPASEVQQGMNRWLGWVRSEPNSAGKLWFVTNAYSSQSASTANNDWDQIDDWTNVVLEMHCYFAPASATDDGWNSTDGLRSSGDGTFWNGWPEASTYNTANKAALRLHLAEWKEVAQTYGVPWIIGEFGVQYNKATATIRDNWARDLVEAAELEECAGVFWWIYGVNETQDPWTASYPSSSPVWRPEALRTATFDAS
jgi:hypothetical protein